MNRNIGLFVIVFIGFTSLFGQTSKSFSGVITDGETGDPIPFPMITDQVGRYIGLGNKNGEFVIKVEPVSETLVFSCVGYMKTEIDLNQKTNMFLSICLFPDTTYLPELVVKPNNLKKKVIGIKTIPEDASVIRYGEWNYTAFATKFKLKDKPTKIESASIHIGRNTVGEFTLRCRITNKKYSAPGEDILIHNEVITSDITSDWVTFDFSDLNLWVDEKVIYLVVEILQDYEFDESKIVKYKVNTPGFSYIQDTKNKSLISTTPGIWHVGKNRIATNLKVSY